MAMDWRSAATRNAAHNDEVDQRRMENLDLLKATYALDIASAARFPALGEFADHRMREEFTHWFKERLAELCDEDLSELSAVTVRRLRESVSGRGGIEWHEMEDALALVGAEMKERNLSRGQPKGKWYSPKVTAEMKLTQEIAPVYSGHRQVAKRIVDEILRLGAAAVLELASADLAHFGKLKRNPGFNRQHAAEIVAEAVKNFHQGVSGEVIRSAAE